MIRPETILFDLKYGIRALSRSSRTTIITVLSLALGIAVNTVVFTAYRVLVGRLIDADKPTEMVNLALTRESGTMDINFSYPDYEEYRDSVRAFSGLVAFRQTRLTLSNIGSGMVDQRTATAGSATSRLGLMGTGARNAGLAPVFIVSENYFKVLGVSPSHGRAFDTAAKGAPAAEPSVLVSEEYWRRRFAGDPAMIGKTIHLNGVAVTVIGITPLNFTGTGSVAPAFWLPTSMEPRINGNDKWLSDRENRPYRLAGRLAPGLTIGQAKAQMDVVVDHVRRLHDAQTESARPVTARVSPGSPYPYPPDQIPGVNLAILLIMSASATVLIVASANVGSLQLARARSREMEWRTRMSIGATRGRIIRQLLTENALVGLLAGMFALLFTWAFLKIAVDTAVHTMPVEYFRLVVDVTPDLTVFAYVFLISVTGGILSGLPPAIQTPRSALASGSKATASVRGRRLQDLLVAVQVGLSLVLMITGSMFVRGSINALGMETGYDSEHLVQLDVQFPNASTYDAARRLAVFNELRTQISALPGVAAVTSARPPASQTFRTAALPVDVEKGSARLAESLQYYTYIQPGYFETMGIPLLLGRGFERQGQDQQSVILSESAARQIWPGENPIGRSLRLGLIDERLHPRRDLVANGPIYKIAGVARDKRGLDFDGSDSHQIYLLLPDDRIDSRPLIIRTRSNPVPLIDGIERTLASVDPEIVATSTTLEEALRHSGAFLGSTLAAAFASSIGMLGLLLALTGIFGTVSHIVAIRTREVGIRMAVGAQKHDILRLILRESTRPVFAGLIAGMTVAVGVVYLLRGILYGVHAIDGVLFVVVSSLFLAVAMLASYPPVRRAMKVDPVVALRYE